MTQKPDLLPVDGLDRPRDMPLWRNINFQLMWSSIAASGFGDRLVQMAALLFLNINAKGANASSIQASVLFFFCLPYLVFGPLGGIIADKFPRKWILFVCDEARGVSLFIAALTIWWLAPNYNGDPIPPDHDLATFATVSTFGFIAMVGAFAAIFGTTRDAMTPQIVPLRNLQAANAIILAIASIFAMIGYAAGGKIIEWSVVAAIFIAAGCYLVTGSFWAFVKPTQHTTILPKEELEKRSGGLMPAVRYILGHKRIMQLFGVSLFFWTLVSIFLAVLAAMVKSPAYFNIPKNEVVAYIGYLQGSVGVGMLISSGVLMVMRDLRRAPKMIVTGLALCGFSLGLMWLNTHFYTALGLSFMVGFFSNFARVGTDSLTQAISANYIRGRVFGVRDVLTNSAMVITNLIIWRQPEADTRMINLLPWLAILMVGAGITGFWLVKHTGPKRRASQA